ncbi:MAG: hypothetical protein AB1765_06740 [Candidatus Hydrogenedentota bacterium]
MLFGFGTYFFSFAVGEARIPFSIFVILLSVYIIKKRGMKFNTKDYLTPAFLGFISGLMGLMRYEYSIYGFALFLCILWKSRNLASLYFLSGFIIPILTLCFYHYAVFGSPIRSSYDLRLEYYEYGNPQISVAMQSRVSKDRMKYLLIGEGKSLKDDKKFGLSGVLTLKYFLNKKSVKAWLSDCISLSHGFYVYFPGGFFIIFSIIFYRLSSIYAMVSKPETSLYLLFVLLYYFFLAFLGGGGASATSGLGPRYQILLIPVFVLLYPVLFAFLPPALEKSIWTLSMIFGYIGAVAEQIPRGSSAIIYSIKELIAKTGASAVFVKTIPEVLGLNTLYAFIIKDEVTITNVISYLGKNLFIKCLTLQMCFASLFYFILIYSIIKFSRLFLYYAK